MKVGQHGPKRYADLHPAPAEYVRDWDEPANRDQFRTPTDLAAPFLAAVTQYAQDNNVTWQYAYWVMQDGADMTSQHPPTWLK